MTEVFYHERLAEGELADLLIDYGLPALVRPIAGGAEQWRPAL